MERKLLMKTIWRTFFLATSLIALPCANGQDMLKLGKEIATNLGYPADRLNIADESAKYAEKTKGEVFAVAAMKSDDGTFASTGIAFSKRGSLLTREIEDECEESISSGNNKVTRFDLPEGGYGYTGLGALGPGGSEERILATFPKHGVDFQLKLTIPGDGLASDDTSKSYHDLITNGGMPLVEKLKSVVANAAVYAKDASSSKADDTQAKRPELNNPGESVKSGDQASEKDGAKPLTTENSSNTKWIIIVAVLLLIGVLAGVLKRR